MKKDEFKPKRKTRLTVALIVSLMSSVLLIGQAWAQYKITKHSINNGGGISVSGGQNHKVTGSIGQKEANNSSSGGGFNVTGGFWSTGPEDDLVFKNGFDQ